MAIPLQVGLHARYLSGMRQGGRRREAEVREGEWDGLQFPPLSTLTESGSRCCSRKAENSTRRSLVVPMERPCQAGTEGAGADAGSNPERPIVTLKRGCEPPPRRPQANSGAGRCKTAEPGGEATVPPPPESRGGIQSGGGGVPANDPRGTMVMQLLSRPTSAPCKGWRTPPTGQGVPLGTKAREAERAQVNLAKIS